MIGNNFYISQNASSTAFDNSTNGFVSDNVQDAIEEAKNTGGGGTPTPFVPNIIFANETITIPPNKQLVIYRRLKVEGTLIITGELCLI